MQRDTGVWFICCPVDIGIGIRQAKDGGGGPRGIDKSDQVSYS